MGRKTRSSTQGTCRRDSEEHDSKSSSPPHKRQKTSGSPPSVTPTDVVPQVTGPEAKIAIASSQSEDIDWLSGSLPTEEATGPSMSDTSNILGLDDMPEQTENPGPGRTEESSVIHAENTTDFPTSNQLQDHGQPENIDQSSGTMWAQATNSVTSGDVGTETGDKDIAESENIPEVSMVDLATSNDDVCKEVNMDKDQHQDTATTDLANLISSHTVTEEANKAVVMETRSRMPAGTVTSQKNEEGDGNFSPSRVAREPESRDNRPRLGNERSQTRDPGSWDEMFLEGFEWVARLKAQVIKRHVSLVTEKDRYISGLKDDNRQLEVENARVYAQRKDAEEQLASIRKKRTHVGEWAPDPGMKEVRRELEQKDEQILQLRQSLGHMTSRYSTLQQSKKGMEGYRNQLDWDEEVQKAYKTLGYHIKNFCETCLGGKPFIKGVNKDQAENFNSMTAKSIWEVCLQDEDYKAKFFQGAVWHYLCLHLLSYPLAAYSKPMSDGMSQVQIAQLSEYRLKKDTPRMARLNAWRRDTGRLLHESLGAEPNNAWSFSPVHCNHVATEMAKLFHRYSGAGTLEVVQSQLRNVVDLAVKLASLISRADAHYLVAYHGKYLNEASYGFKAERASMKILISFSGHLDDYDVPVDFVIRPGLLRYGEPDGEGMERNVLVKTLICV